MIAFYILAPIPLVLARNCDNDGSGGGLELARKLKQIFYTNPWIFFFSFPLSGYDRVSICLAMCTRKPWRNRGKWLFCNELQMIKKCSVGLVWIRDGSEHCHVRNNWRNISLFWGWRWLLWILSILVVKITCSSITPNGLLRNSIYSQNIT